MREIPQFQSPVDGRLQSLSRRGYLKLPVAEEKVVRVYLPKHQENREDGGVPRYRYRFDKGYSKLQGIAGYFGARFISDDHEVDYKQIRGTASSSFRKLVRSVETCQVWGNNPRPDI